MSDFREDEFLSDQQRAQLPANTSPIPSDVATGSASEGDLGTTPLGAPPAGYDVRSTYDSRPVQAFDFNITVENTLEVQPLAQFAVPAGYVCVLRRIHHSFNPVPIIFGRSDVKVSLLVNGNAVLYNKNVPMGVESDDILECFVIADEFQMVQAQWAIAAAAMIASTLSTHFYGQFILKTGIPKEFEIANPTSKRFSGGAPISSVIAPPVQALPEAPAPVITAAPAQEAAPVKRALMHASGGKRPVYDRRTGKILGYR